MDEHTRQQFDLEQIRAVIALAAEAEIAELEVESPTLRVLVRKTASGTAYVVSPPAAGGQPVAPVPPAGPSAAVPSPAPVPPVAGDAAGPETNHLRPITAPMVGTFYRAANPEAPPFVEEGDVVEPGQTVCVIEAMKLFNEIQSELRGRVVMVLAENGAPVEYGQPLFLLEPPAGS